MTIEFPCTQCQQKLSVPNESAGKKAKCPSCFTVLDVPDVAPQAFATTPNPAAGPFGEANPSNPYAAPVPTSAPSQVPMGQTEHPIFDPIQCLSEAWRLFQQNAGVMVAATLIILGIAFLFGFVAGFVQEMGVQAQSPPIVLAGMLISFSGNVLQAFMAIGMFRLCFAVARGEPVEIGMVFSGGQYFWRYLGVSILFGLGMLAGMMLFIIPGIFFAITYWPSMLLVIDRNAGVFESFEIAGRIAKGNRINSLLLGILAFALQVVGMLMCLVGILVTLPIINLMGAVAYLTMTGQRAQIR